MAAAEKNASGPRRPRIREHGIRIGNLQPGQFNAITDVPGVLVGHSTIIEGAGELTIGKGPARTGVTAILPHERNTVDEPVEAAHYVLNGSGTTMGLSYIDEYGQIEMPILLTNTFSVGAVFDAAVRYMVRRIYAEGEKLIVFSPEIAEEVGRLQEFLFARVYHHPRSLARFL